MRPMSSSIQMNTNHQLIQMTKATVSSTKMAPVPRSRRRSLRHRGCQMRNSPRWASIMERDRALPKSPHRAAWSNNSISPSSRFSRISRGRANMPRRRKEREMGLFTANGWSLFSHRGTEAQGRSNTKDTGCHERTPGGEGHFDDAIDDHHFCLILFHLRASVREKYSMDWHE